MQLLNLLEMAIGKPRPLPRSEEALLSASAWAALLKCRACRVELIMWERLPDDEVYCSEW